MTDPFDQGLDKACAMRLLANAHTKADYRAYQKTGHWKTVREEALLYAAFSCCMCGRADRLQVHHKPSGYQRLFRERVDQDVTVVCQRCHRRHHGK